eukprot:CAMPEP_0115313768 /NCGR_PEP_ID=MMETSP0270-20121206/76654_1 /TAXON_ID=71861 /ORGANISM="Scrippsiella trochoidea, Strain CCMP3099" /LENGTH=55 /DNA_ID=CAMNT_0002732907 /DNA_START=433 /DNA_END=600 /DNA_ORIENTATION=-
MFIVAESNNTAIATQQHSVAPTSGDLGIGCAFFQLWDVTSAMSLVAASDSTAVAA